MSQLHSEMEGIINALEALDIDLKKDLKLINFYLDSGVARMTAQDRATGDITIYSVVATGNSLNQENSKDSLDEEEKYHE